MAAREDVTLAPGGWLRHWPRFLPRAEADALQQTLQQTIPWEQRDVVLFGRSVPQPRLVHWMAEFPYTYSGLTLAPSPWTPEVLALKVHIEQALGGARFNGVLLNLYRDGRDSMGFHADDEPELVPDAAIASVSLGLARRFVLKPHRHDAPEWEHRLAHGSLLVMGGTVQRHWRHGVPREKGATGSRINLTFRQYRE